MCCCWTAACGLTERLCGKSCAPRRRCARRGCWPSGRTVRARRRMAPCLRTAAAQGWLRCFPCSPKSRCPVWQRLTVPGHSGRQSVFWTRWECAGNGRDGAMRRGACAAGSPSPDWISSPSTGCTRSAPAPSASAPGRWSAASGWPWRACSPWAAFPRSSVSSGRPSTRTRASPPTGPF